LDKVLTKQPSSTILANLKEITKMRLSVSVVFSSVAGYFLGAQVVDFVIVLLLSIGGYLLVGASNSFNQVLEIKRDKLMDRTKNRPLPSGRMSVSSALFIGFSFGLGGLTILYFINPITAFFGLISILLYVLVYTPLKTKTPLSVFVGAFPGAIPFMMGWIAATNDFSIEPGTLFMIQFFWQFPHFWALGWWLYDDYKKGGFFMLPTGKRDRGTAIQIILYTIWTVVISIVPVFGLTGQLTLSITAAVLIGLLGLGMLFYAVKLYRERSVKVAKQLMFASVSYITLLQIIYVFDKYIRIWI
jgi:protoheme IX farnesyltransferase